MRCTVWCTILGVQYYYDTYITYLLCGLPYVLIYMVYGILLFCFTWYTVFSLWYCIQYSVCGTVCGIMLLYTVFCFTWYTVLFLWYHALFAMHIGGKE